MPGKQTMRLALVDDHTLFRKGLINLIELVCSDCDILFEADNGFDLQQKITKENEKYIITVKQNEESGEPRIAHDQRPHPGFGVP